VPQNVGVSVGYLWGRVRDADLWDFCGARGRPRWLSALGVQRLDVLLHWQACGQDLSAGRSPEVEF
jgi:hypothetical protein